MNYFCITLTLNFSQVISYLLILVDMSLVYSFTNILFYVTTNISYTVAENIFCNNY